MAISSKILQAIPLNWQAFLWKNLYKLVQQKRLPHSIFLKGVAQSGKTHFGVAFAQLLLCEAPQLILHSNLYKSCQQCRACHLFQANTHPNYHYITPLHNELKKEIISIEMIRNLTTTLQKTAWSSNSLSPLQDYHTVVLIDSADALQTAANNALLKTLEEPMPGIVFILLSENAHSVPATIKSRCHSITLPIPSFDIGYVWLSEKIEKMQPTIDTFTIKLSLQVANHNPLKGLLLLQKKRIEHSYQVIFESFMSLMNPSVNPSEIAQIWSKQPTEMVFDSLMQITQWLIQMQLGDRHILDNFKFSAKNLSVLLSQKNAIALLDYFETLKTVRADFRQSHLNVLLSFEKLAYAFTRKNINEAN